MRGGDLTFFASGTVQDRGAQDVVLTPGKSLDPRVMAKAADALERAQRPGPGEIVFHMTPHEHGMLVAQIRGILPSDTDHNRGAFVAVGCWSPDGFEETSADLALRWIELVHNHLATFHESKGSHRFRQDFRLAKYAGYPPDTAMQKTIGDLARVAAGEARTRTYVRARIADGTLAQDAARATKLRPAEPAPDPIGKWLHETRVVTAELAGVVQSMEAALSRAEGVQEGAARVARELGERRRKVEGQGARRPDPARARVGAPPGSGAGVRSRAGARRVEPPDRKLSRPENWRGEGAVILAWVVLSAVVLLGLGVWGIVELVEIFSGSENGDEGGESSEIRSEAPDAKGQPNETSPGMTESRECGGEGCK